MTDFTPPPAAASIPTPIEQTLALVIRHGATALGGFLVANGALSNADAASFAQVATGLALGLGGMAWSFYQKHNANKALVAAINAPAAVPPVESPPTKG